MGRLVPSGKTAPGKKVIPLSKPYVFMAARTNGEQETRRRKGCRQSIRPIKVIILKVQKGKMKVPQRYDEYRRSPKNSPRKTS